MSTQKQKDKEATTKKSTPSSTGDQTTESGKAPEGSAPQDDSQTTPENTSEESIPLAGGKETESDEMPRESASNSSAQATKSEKPSEGSAPLGGKTVKPIEAPEGSLSGASSQATESKKAEDPTSQVSGSEPTRSANSQKTAATHHDANNLPYDHSSLALGRNRNIAIILIMGTSGHGKSRTINRLVGYNLLEVGTNISGSTTKTVQRVDIPIHDRETNATITLAFDDTPGTEDTTFEDRARNAFLLRRYSKEWFPDAEQDVLQFADGAPSPRHRLSRKTYPNVILLVAAWDSVKPDAHNDPQKFTSAIGKAMVILRSSNLVDPFRTNVIIVVTKSLSSWKDYDDYEDGPEKDSYWNRDAREKTKIIEALQHKVFPKLRPWHVVFIENGGGRLIPKLHERLPNGELSHLNLFKAIRDLFTVTDGEDMPQDLVGLHALPLLTGAESLHSHYKHCRFRRICELPLSETISEEDTRSLGLETIGNEELLSPTSPAPNQLHELAKNVLGFTYNPIFRHFGRSCVLDLEPSSVHIVECGSRQFEQIVRAKDAKEQALLTATHLRADFKMRDVAGLQCSYSSSTHLESAASSESHLYVARKLSGLATVLPLCPQLSPAMLAEIEKLPPWSPEAASKYHDFFTSYGTHVVLRAAIGGVLRIVAHGDMNLDEEVVKKALEAEFDNPILKQAGIDARLAARHERSSERRVSSGKVQVTVFRDGGDKVASQLSEALQKLFTYLLNPSPSPSLPLDWLDVRLQWMDALKTDPVFCADDPITEYQWLYNLEGLTVEQRRDLKLASKSYLQAPVEKRVVPPAPKRTFWEKVLLPRDKNLKEAHKTFKSARRRWDLRFRPWVMFKKKG